MNSQREHFDKDRLNAISITEVARRLGDSLRRAGTLWKTCCPWHADERPSLVFYERTGENHCHCFSCGQGGDVIAYVMQHESWTFQEACQWLSSEFGISTMPAGTPVPRPKPRPAIVKKEPAYAYIPMTMVDPLVSAENSLCRCLMQLFRSEAVEWLTEEYRLGCYSLYGQDDYTVFPSIDGEGRVCNLKVQHYDADPASPRFGHNDGKTYWLGSMWVGEGRLPKGSVFRQDCLFGAHLLQRYPDSTVALVESPKNALYGALSFPSLLWVAAGNKGNLKRDVLKPLQGRNVLVVPDCDAVDEWADAVNELTDLANFTVSDFCRRRAPADQPKYDIADYLQQMIRSL